MKRIMPEKNKTTKNTMPSFMNQNWRTVKSETEKVKDLLTDIPTNNIKCKCGSYPPCLVEARVGDILTLYTDQSHTWHGQKGSSILLPFLRAEHTCCLTAAILDFAKGAFFEANRGKTHTLYLYLPELLKGITEIVFYFVFSFTVKEGSKTGLKKERRPIANKQLLYQSSLLPHFLPHGTTVTSRN